ncbi:MAG TPA: hypothetical protein G4N95_09465 [Anaerolineae bacterium]|nr:hypothetical protein [Anaerolineae bacterium]
MMMRKVPQPGWNLEYLMFVFTRLSGLAMFILAIVGVAMALIMGARTQMDLGTLMRWTFFQNPNHVLDSNIPDVTAGWANGFWQIMEMLVIFLAATHGFNGLRVILDDYIHSIFWQYFLRVILFILWVFAIILGIYVILGS